MACDDTSRNARAWQATATSSRAILVRLAVSRLWFSSWPATGVWRGRRPVVNPRAAWIEELVQFPWAARPKVEAPTPAHHVVRPGSGRFQTSRAIDVIHTVELLDLGLKKYSDSTLGQLVVFMPLQHAVRSSRQKKKTTPPLAKCRPHGNKRHEQTQHGS
jgi:hypothetical protein